jgi:ferredoxin, 2Fe-2S
MRKIIISNLNYRQITVKDAGTSLLKSFQEEFLDWMHACGGKGRCTTCKVVMESGAELLSPPSEAELLYRSKEALNQNERLACQAKLAGEGILYIRVPEECKLPHLDYSY